MAAATATRVGVLLADVPKGHRVMGLGTSDTTYLGMTLVTLNTDGEVIPFAVGDENEVVGLCKEEIIIPSTVADGARKIEIWRGVVAAFVGAGFTAADVGKQVYAFDNQSVRLSPTAGDTLLGEITEVESATKVWVRIYDDAGRTQEPA